MGPLNVPCSSFSPSVEYLCLAEPHTRHSIDGYVRDIPMTMLPPRLTSADNPFTFLSPLRRMNAMRVAYFLRGIEINIPYSIIGSRCSAIAECEGTVWAVNEIGVRFKIRLDSGFIRSVYAHVAARRLWLWRRLAVAAGETIK